MTDKPKPTDAEVEAVRVAVGYMHGRVLKDMTFDQVVVAILEKIKK